VLPDQIVAMSLMEQAGQCVLQPFGYGWKIEILHVKLDNEFHALM
jgi:hypothetical protein